MTDYKPCAGVQCPKCTGTTILVSDEVKSCWPGIYQYFCSACEHHFSIRARSVREEKADGVFGWKEIPPHQSISEG